MSVTNIYNCIVIDDERLAREGLESYIAKTPFLNNVGSYENPLQVLGNHPTIDIIFSDIDMPEMDGIQFLKSMTRPPIIIFVSGKPNFAVDGYDLDVLDFLLKPFDYSRFLKAANKAKEKLETLRKAEKRPQELVIKDRHIHKIIDLDSIYCIQGSGDYVDILTLNGNYTICDTLISIMRLLPEDRFMKVQKSYIVNLDFIKDLSANEITLKSNQGKIPIGPNFREALFRRFGIA